MNLEEKLAEYMELYFAEKFNNTKLRDELTEQKKAVENFAEHNCRMIDYLTYELGYPSELVDLIVTGRVLTKEQVERWLKNN